MTCEAKFWGQIGCTCEACDLERREQVKAFAARKFEELEWAERIRDARIREREAAVTVRPPHLRLPTRELGDSPVSQENPLWWEEVAA